jgi:hypothetical protein
MALRIVRSYRVTAMKASLGGFPAGHYLLAVADLARFVTPTA